MLFEIPLYESFHSCFFFLFIAIGAFAGSFFNVLTGRWPDNIIAQNDAQALMWLKLRGAGSKVNEMKHPHLPLLAGRSQCLHCDKKIPFYLNIPVVSWIMLRGKTSCCKNPIEIRYLLWEVIGIIVFAAVYSLIGPSMYGLIVGLTLMWLLVISQLDFRIGLIPEGAMKTLAVMVAILCSHPSSHGMEQAFINFMLTLIVLGVPVLLIEHATGKSGMGMSDIYLVAIAFALLDDLFFIASAAMFAIFFVTIAIFKLGNIERGLFVKIIGDKAIPAGPAICISVFIFYFVSIYFNLNGVWWISQYLI